MSSDEEKIYEIFSKVAWLDKNRWSPNLNSKSLINFSSPNLKNSEKILTHFLCYISDRQMSFSQIWDKGGFVYSDIVHTYNATNINTENLLKPDNSLNPDKSDSIEKSNSFFREKETSTGKKYTFISKSKVPKNNLLIQNYGFEENQYVTFIPRYYPSDLKSIMQTLVILEEFEKNILSFVARIMDNNLDDELLIKKIAFAFYLLAYYNIGQPKGIQFDLMKRDTQGNKQKVIEILNKDEMFEEEFKNFKKIIFNQKRVWCTLRDYVKFGELNNYIVGGFEEIGRKDLVFKWKNLNKKELELPGDVWNNNIKFRNCLFDDLDYVKENKRYLKFYSPNFNSSFFIRKLYENYKGIIDCGYPEMFDVTFDFIPRMCEEEMCDFCIFNGNNKIEDICIKDKSKFCTVLMISCGYVNKCNPEECEICQK